MIIFGDANDDTAELLGEPHPLLHAETKSRPCANTSMQDSQAEMATTKKKETQCRQHAKIRHLWCLSEERCSPGCLLARPGYELHRRLEDACSSVTCCLFKELVSNQSNMALIAKTVLQINSRWQANDASSNDGNVEHFPAFWWFVILFDKSAFLQICIPCNFWPISLVGVTSKGSLWAGKSFTEKNKTVAGYFREQQYRSKL